MALQAVYSASYARLASDSAGATVRAALGTTTSFLTVEKLRGTLPTLPLLAWQGGGVEPSQGDADDMPFGWWIYDNPLQGFYRIDGLFDLIRAAYPHDWLADSFTARTSSPKEQPDTALTMLVRPIWFTVSKRL